MDIISFNEASTANGRIENFIENPDSTSGVLTVPKTIAAGETITIPEGRVAILPNVQIDGTLDIQGEVFIPSGATTSSVVEKVTSTDNAIVRFDGTTGDVQNSGVTISDNGTITFPPGARITGDFSTAASNRVMFQSNVTNGNTGVYAIPNAALGVAAFRVANSNDLGNTNTLEISASQSATSIVSSYLGTASPLPLTFVVSGAERVRIDTNGNVGIGVTPSAWHSNISAIDFGYDGYLYSRKPGDGTNLGSNSYTDNDTTWKYKNTWYATRYEQLNGTHKWYTAPSGTAGNVIPWTTAMTLDASGNLLLTSGTGALGYGTGAGGTVTQLTNKSTAVTLNKPTGQIIMNNAALAAGASVSFTLNNTLISTSGDSLLVTINNAVSGYNYKVDVAGLLGGIGAQIRLTNISASTLSDAVSIDFAIIKGANS